MKISKSQKNNLIFLVIIALLIIPQTRQPIQVFLHKGLSLIGPSVINPEDRINIDNISWKLEDLNGNTFDYSSTKNKVVLINFWATWCLPCIAEMPSFEKLYNDYNDKIVFLFVSSESKDKISKYIENNNYSFKVYNPKSQYPKYFNVRSIPRTFLIDKKGNIVIDKTGATNWNSNKIRSTLDKLI